jgi:MoaA/NifB/PqqE/SkfB family radical SAM enzyme
MKKDKSDEKYQMEKFRQDCGFYLSRELAIPLIPPENVYLEITSRCTLRCKICNIWTRTDKDEISKGECLKIIDDMAEMGIPHLIISGGEPFLRDFVIEISDYAKKRGIAHVSVISNGTLIDDKKARAIANSGIDHVTISIDGLEESNDYVRGKGSFKKAVNAIKLLKKYGGKKCAGELTVGINCVIQNRNLEELTRLVRLAKKLGCNIIVFQPMLSDNVSMHKRLMEDELWVPEERLNILEKNMNALIQMKKEKAYSDLIYVEPIVLKLIKDYYSGNLGQNNIKCYDGYIRIVINSHGSLWMCDSNYGESRERTLRECFYSPLAYELRAGIKDCKKPCLQACVLKPELEGLEQIAKRFAKGLKKGERKDAEEAISILEEYERVLPAQIKTNFRGASSALSSKKSVSKNIIREIQLAKRIIQMREGEL